MMFNEVVLGLSNGGGGQIPVWVLLLVVKHDLLPPLPPGFITRNEIFIIMIKLDYYQAKLFVVQNKHLTYLFKSSLDNTLVSWMFSQSHSKNGTTVSQSNSHSRVSASNSLAFG